MDVADRAIYHLGMDATIRRWKRQLHKAVTQNALHEAQLNCERILKRDPRDLDAWLILLQVFLRRRQFDHGELCRQQIHAQFHADAGMHHALAGLYQRNGLLAMAVQELQSALLLSKHDLGLCAELAALLMHQQRYQDVMDVLNPLLAGGHENSQCRFLLGAACQAMQDIDAAAEHYRRACDLDADNHDAAVGLANIAFMRRDHTNTAAILEPLLNAAVPPVSAVILFGQYASQAGEQTRAIRLLQATLARGDIATPQRAMLCFALGKLYDDLQDYASAFAQYQQGNALSGVVYDAVQAEHYFSGIQRIFTRDYIAERQCHAAAGERLVFIVGMPRSGTSLVEQVLAAHHEVYGAGELALLGNLVHAVPAEHGLGSAFPQDYQQVNAQVLSAIAEGYLQHIEQLNTTAALVTDKMPGNFHYLGIINALFPRARIIHCSRDPLDTCLSCYFQQFSGHYPFAYDLAHLGHYYGCYQRLMQHWRQTLSVPIFELRYEALVTDSESTMRSLIEFLGLPWSERCREFHESERVITTASSQQASRRLYKSSLQRWKHYEEFLGSLRSALNGSGVQFS